MRSPKRAPPGKAPQGSLRRTAGVQQGRRMPTIPPVTRNFMLVCVAAYCLTLLWPEVKTWLALWQLGSGNFWPWQLFTYALLHGDLNHLLFNMLGLWMFGAELENYWGAKRYMQFGVVSAIAAALTQLVVMALMGGAGFTVGASGILFGLLIGYALTFPNRRFDLVGFLPMALMMVPLQIFNILGMVLFFLLLTNRQAVPIPPIPIPAMTMVMIYGVIELLLGLFLRTGVAHFAHLGGLLGGYLMIRFWPMKRRR
jgi:membrane associated rhomboid family serine protease